MIGEGLRDAVELVLHAAAVPPMVRVSWRGSAGTFCVFYDATYVHAIAAAG